MILKWLAGDLFSLPRWIWAVGGLLLLLVFLFWLEARDDKQNQEIGAAIEREEALRETLERTEEGNEIRESISRGSRAAYNECLQSARTPENCVGLLPEQSGD